MWDKHLFMTREQIRNYDKIAVEQFGIESSVLMENAGKGAVEVILKRYPNAQQIAIIAGPGNNGGDGFVVARHLANSGKKISVFLVASEPAIRGDAKLNLEIIKKMHLTITPVSQDSPLTSANLLGFDLLIDALLGTGVSRNLDGLLYDTVQAVNLSLIPTVSLDIPSGLNSDTGFPCGTAVKANSTVTFGHLKRGLLLFPGAELAGEIDVVPIGAPNIVSEQSGFDGRLISKHHIISMLPTRKKDGHKGTFGHLLIVGGFLGKTGAAALTGKAALRTGCGLVTIATSREAQPVLESKCLEVMVDNVIDENSLSISEEIQNRIEALLKNKKAVVIGPGLGTEQKTSQLVIEMLKLLTVPTVLDADGINILADIPAIAKEMKAPFVLTPHPGEMSKLMGESVQLIQQDRIGICRKAAERFQAVIVLKGAHTIIAAPDGKVFVNPTGNSGMGTAGTGDVLTGIIGGLLAQGVKPLEAALSGVYLHGEAGDLAAKKCGERSLVASNLIENISCILKEWFLDSCANLSVLKTID